MNYLAHAFLSKNDPELLVGNFIADHLRGSQLFSFPEKIRKGIQLHREIDSFTDVHPAFRASKRLFYDGFEKHSGILVDIWFDYFLAKNFSLYSVTDLRSFSENVYRVYSDYINLMPTGSSRFLNYVIRNNIYTAYGTVEGMEKVLYHLSQRIRHNVRLDESVKLLTKNEVQLQRNFELFFSDLQKHFASSSSV